MRIRSLELMVMGYGELHGSGCSLSLPFASAELGCPRPKREGRRGRQLLKAWLKLFEGRDRSSSILLEGL